MTTTLVGVQGIHLDTALHGSLSLAIRDDTGGADPTLVVIAVPQGGSLRGCVTLPLDCDDMDELHAWLGERIAARAASSESRG